MQQDESGFAADDALPSDVAGPSSGDGGANPNSDDSAADTSWLASADLTIADGPGAGPDLISFEDFYDGKHQSLLADAATPLAPPTSGQGFSWPNSIEQLQSGSLIPDPGSASQTTDSGPGSDASNGSIPPIQAAETAPIVAAVTPLSGVILNLSPVLPTSTATDAFASTQPVLSAQVFNSLPVTGATTSAATQLDTASSPPPIDMGPILGGDTDLLPSGSGSQSGTGGTGGSSGSDGGTFLSVTSNSSAFVINLSFDSSCASAPAGFETDVEEVAQYYESLFNVAATINIDVGYGEVDGSSVGGALGSSLYYENAYTYSQVESALVASNATGASTLSGSDPTGGGWFFLTTAEAKAIGLASGSSTDGYIGFDSAANAFDYNNSNGVTAGQYDFFGVAAHEISEVMGRMFPGAGYYSALSLFDFTSAGTRDVGSSPPGYFSINNGTTNLDNFNTNANGDYGDWAGSAGANAYLAFANPGTTLAVTGTDVTLMSALGWTLATPAAPIISNDTVNANNSVTLTGTAIAEGTVSVYDGSTLLGTTTAADSESWSFTTADLSNGTHSITATVTDPGGTSAASNAVDPIIGSSSGPTISSLTETPSSGDLDVGKTVTLTLTLSEVVTVADGTPTLTLNDGSTASYASGSGSSALTFSYTVGAGQNTSGLQATAVNLNSATITDGSGNAASLSLNGLTQTGPQIDTTAPAIASIADTPSSGDLNAGKTVTFTLNLSEAVTVAGGTPTLTLNDGGAASYVSGSGTNGLTFSYTVGSGQNTSALVATAVNLNSATITDGAGNAASLSLTGLSQAGPQITTAGPTLSSVAESPSSGDLNAGKTVTFTLNLSEAVTVAGGTPTLTLNDGGTASYTSGSGTNALTFSYTVGSGQNASALAATAVNLNSATITDGAGNAASLSLNGLTQTGPQINTNTPFISSLSETPSSGHLKAGKVVTLTLDMSEAVNVNTSGGTPTITLNDGGTAAYVSGSGTNALTFSYTVLTGQNTPDLVETAVNLNGATIADGAGNAANLSLAGLPQGSPSIDTTAPTISSLTETPPNGDLKIGDMVTLTLTLGEAVTVGTSGGTPTLALNDGGTATYVSGSGTNTLLFSYTVGARQNTASLADTAVNLNSATITDDAGNAANLSLAGLTQVGPQIQASPQLTPSQLTASMTVGQSVNWSSLFNAAVVPNGQTITDYWVTSDPRVGQWYYNGQAITGEIVASELSGLTFHGVGSGTDTVYLQASDDGGNTWSAWQGNQVTVTISEPPPASLTPTQSTASMTIGQSVNWSSLFNAAVVPNGQTVTDYWVTSDPRVGQWYYNGQAITGEIAAFELPSLTFQGVGPGTDTVYLQASDDGGNTWSAWTGNGVTVTASGLYATPGSVLQDYQPLAGAAASATVGIGSTLILWASDSASVTFQGSTGLLELEQPTSFTGEINNFSGNGTLAGSDQIDLNGFSFTSIQDSYSNGVLTLGNGAQSATLDFSGSYVLANFDFANDGHGGTLVYDPPVTSNLNSSKSSTPEGSAWDVSGPSSLGYSSNGAQSPVPMAGGHQNTTLALLANYMASSFPTAASNDAGPMSEAAPNLASTQWQLATNHHA